MSIETNNDKPMIEHALGPLRYGLKVLPCKPKAKIPDRGLVPNGSTDATDSEEQIRKWWAESPSANIGVTSDDGIIVDIDEGVTCIEDVKKFAEAHNLPWPTLTIRTGRRPEFGAQLHYRGEARSRSYKVDGILGEVRGHHLYGLWHGSTHPLSGETYQIILDTPRAQFTGGERLVRKAGSNEDTHEGEPRTKQQIRGTLDVLITNAGKAEQGTRNEFSHKAAWFAARALLSGALESTEAELKVRLFAAVNPLYAPGERDVRHMVDDSWRRGAKAEPLFVLDSVKVHDEALARVDGWFGDVNATANPTFEDAASWLSLLSAEEYATRRKRAFSRLDVRAADLDGAVSSRKAKADAPPPLDETEIAAARQETTEFIDELNKKYFVIENLGSKCRVAWQEADPHPDPSPAEKRRQLPHLPRERDKQVP